MRTKCLPVHLPLDEYRRLEQVAEANERDPLQQARWFVRQALIEPPTPVRDVEPPATPGEAPDLEARQ